jgi:heat shock protein HslJ
MKKIFIVLSICVTILACKSKHDAVNDLEEMQESERSEATAEALFEDMHNSQNSLSYQGSYYGLLPCDGCMGIQFKLIFHQDSTYTTQSIYLGKSDEILEKKGRYNWDEFGSEITCRIDNRIVARYKVEENRLVQFGQQGRINGETEARYILHKNPNPLWNKPWFALSFQGVDVNKSELKPNLTFLPSGQVHGTGGCNSLHAKYSLIEDQKIKVGAVASTKKGCGNIPHFDQELSEALRKSASYKVEEKSKLKLIDVNGHTIAVFEAKVID